MKKIFVIIPLLALFGAFSAPCQETEINSEVLIAEPGLEFFVIGAGENEGIELGDGLIVHRSGEKIAEAYIIEVRPDVSAAEILSVEQGKEIQEGDGILIVKETPKAEESGKEDRRPALTVMTGIEQVPAVSPEIIKEGDIVSVDIERPAKEVFSYARMILMENGFSIISSNRSAGIILASKPITLSIMKELWTDAVAAIGHNIVVSLDIKDKDRVSELKASSFMEHSQKGRQIKRAVTRDSGYYNELMVLVSKIKERSEY